MSQRVGPLRGQLRRALAAGAALVAIAVISCKDRIDDGGGPPPGTKQTCAYELHPSGAAFVGGSEKITLEKGLDAEGTPIEDVHFSCPLGAFNPAVVTPDASGNCETNFEAGQVPGDTQITVTYTDFENGQPVSCRSTLNITVLPGDASSAPPACGHLKDPCDYPASSPSSIYKCCGDEGLDCQPKNPVEAPTGEAACCAPFKGACKAATDCCVRLLDPNTSFAPPCWQGHCSCVGVGQPCQQGGEPCCLGTCSGGTCQ